jgi:hypothetical protein
METWALKTFVKHVNACVMIWFLLLCIFNLPLPAQQANETTGTGFAVSTDDMLRAAEEKDAEWRRWMDVDANGVRSYWFRYKFTVEDPPAGGTMWITADDDWNFYLNGQYVATDKSEGIDWEVIYGHDVGEFLIQGENIVAVQADDIGNTRHGLVFAMVYQTVPDIQTQLDRMVKNELAAQAERRAEKQVKQQAAQALRESRREPPTLEQLREMRAIEKNKLD